MTTLTDEGLSDTEVQGWLDDSLNSYILGYFVYGETSKSRIFGPVLTMKKGIYTGIFAISIWLLLGENSKSTFCLLLNLSLLSC